MMHRHSQHFAKQLRKLTNSLNDIIKNIKAGENSDTRELLLNVFLKKQINPLEIIIQGCYNT